MKPEAGDADASELPDYCAEDDQAEDCGCAGDEASDGYLRKVGRPPGDAEDEPSDRARRAGFATACTPIALGFCEPLIADGVR
jgi:hypothetical protein